MPGWAQPCRSPPPADIIFQPLDSRSLLKGQWRAVAGEPGQGAAAARGEPAVAAGRRWPGGAAGRAGAGAPRRRLPEVCRRQSEGSLPRGGQEPAAGPGCPRARAALQGRKGRRGQSKNSGKCWLLGDLGGKQWLWGWKQRRSGCERLSVHRLGRGGFPARQPGSRLALTAVLRSGAGTRQ